MGVIEAAAAGPMNQRLDPDDDPDRINVVCTKGLVRRVNEWRARNGFVGKSEAGRILLERALNADDAERAAAEGKPKPSATR